MLERRAPSFSNFFDINLEEKNEEKNQVSEENAQEDSSYDVVISGMGPGALVMAYMAAVNGKRVLLVSDRSPDFVRVQGVHINPHNRAYLLSMLQKELSKRKKGGEFVELHEEDRKFLEEAKVNSMIALKDIERFVKRRLDYLGGVTYLYNAQFVAANLETGRAEVQNNSAGGEKSSVNFAYFVGADGAKHHAANLIKEADGKPLIQYTEKYTSGGHARAYFTVINESQIVLPDKNFLVDYKENHLASLSFNKKAFAEKGKIKCNIIVELPARLLPINEKNITPEEKEKIEQDLQERARKLLGDKNNDLQFEIVKSKKHGDNKDKMKFTVFSVSVHKANQAMVYGEKSERCFILVGDAFHGANYQVGHGFNDAMHGAIKAGELVFKGIAQLNVANYNAYCESLVKEADSSAAALRWGKKVFSRSSVFGSYVQRRMKEGIEDKASYQGAATEKELIGIDNALLAPSHYGKNPRDLCQEMTAYLENVWEQLQILKWKSEDLQGRKKEESYARMQDVYIKIGLYLEKLEKDLKYKEEIDEKLEINHFEAKSLKAIEQAQYILKEQRKLNAFLKNLGLCVGTGIVPYGFFWGIKWLRTDKHLLFNQTDSIRKLNQCKQVIENKPSVRIEDTPHQSSRSLGRVDV